MKKFDFLGKSLVKTFLVVLFVCYTGSAVASLVDLQGATPEEASITVSVNKPANATNALTTLLVYDADFSDEGELIINGNPAIPLFGAAADLGNDAKSANIALSTPASYWIDGNNTLLFRHTSTGGYAIDDVIVLFDVSTEPPVTGSGSVNLSWVAPVERTDGTALALSEIAGYTVYYGTSKGNYPDSLSVNDISATSVTVTDLPIGTYYLVMTTRDTDGRESGYSSMTTIQAYPVDLDGDGDGLADDSDNCTVVVNPLQRDTDLDGYGNYCDPDFDNNMLVNRQDLDYLKSKLFTSDPHADLNGDGIVNLADLEIMKPYFFGSPGPSGLVP